MTDNIIRPDFGTVSYPDPEPLDQAASILIRYADEITRASEQQFGAIDKLAYEVTAYANICARLARELREAARKDEGQDGR